jgi:hypothetical protein
MNGQRSSIVVAIILAASAPALAGDLNSPAFTPREMAHCMMKRARANTAEPYRAAYKACKEQFETARAEGATGTAITAAKLAEAPKQ